MTRTHDAWGHPYPETPASQNRTPWGREVAQESPGRTHDAWGYPKEKVTETYVNAWGREITRTVSETEKPEPKPATPRTPDPNAPTHSLAELLESGFRSFRLTRQQPDGTWEPVPGCVVWPAPKP